MIKLPSLGLLLCSCIQLVDAEAFFSVKFLTFRNARGLDVRGHCCDEGSSSTCVSACDHSFTICLDQVDGSQTDINSCTYGKQISSEIRDTNIISFRDRIANLANPIIWRLPMWPWRVLLKIDVVDIDYHKPADHVAYLSKTISLLPLPNPRGTRFKIGRNVELLFEAKVYCGRNYYGHNCSVPCVARDDHMGHYSCHHINGSKICLDGWTGEDCLVKRNQCFGVSCLNGGTCLDLVHIFECRCPPGYEGRFCEAEINECLGSDVCQHGDCVNTPGSFTCTCFQGFTGNACSTNIDDCSDSPCQNGALCIDRIGDFQCSCPAGYTGKICDTDINECQMKPCRHNGICNNLIGAYSCDCLAGYQGNDCSLDVDECDSGNPCMNQGICINLPGGYTCQCPVGFQGLHCETDINECQDFHVCHHGGVCVNTHGSFTCVCKSEYFGPKCEHDVNECLHNPCKHGGQCRNFPGGYACDCPDRFTGKLCDARVNECTKDVCKNGGNCTDLDDGFKCTCSQFWTGVTCEQNVDECLSDPCKHGGTCQNLEDGFLCICQVGFQGRVCETFAKECDVVKCQNMSICSQDMDASNCLCYRGWHGQKCQEDSNECQNQMCDNNGTCLNRESGLNCVCSVPWTGQRCEFDVNNCGTSKNHCKNGATCHSVPDGFICECPFGWTGSLCDQDVNECSQDPGICQTLVNSKIDFSNHEMNETDAHMVCENTIPGYRCVCHQNWTGLFCSEDVDECKENPYICIFGNDVLKNLADDSNMLPIIHILCINLYPGYACDCTEGWTGHNCETQIHNLHLASDSPSSTNVHDSKTVMRNGSGDTQLPGCDSPDCVVPGHVNPFSDDHKSTELAALNTRTLTRDLNTNLSSEDANATGYLSGNHSDTMLPLYLACPVTPESGPLVDIGLEQFFWDTHLFLGTRLSVSHRSQIWTSRYGKVVTAIFPTVEVNDRKLSNSEVNDIISSMADKFDDYVRCPSSEDAANSATPSWFPGFISVCALVVLVVASLAMFKVIRRFRKGKKQTFNIHSRKISRSFKNATYKTRPEDSPPKHEDNSSVAMRVVKDRMSIRSLVNMLEGQDSPNGCPLPPKSKPCIPAVERLPGETVRVSDDQPMEDAGQDRGLQTASRNTPSAATEKDRLATQRVSRTEYSTPAIRYINIPNIENKDMEETASPTYRHIKQQSSYSRANVITYPYIEMLQNKETKAEVHTADKARHSQPPKAMADRKMMAQDMECDKYRGFPYIDDPGYTEIITKEEQELPSAK